MITSAYEILRAGGSSLDAVITAVTMLEDDALFNAGYGAVFTAEGQHELDASIMDGANLKAGSVAGVTRVKNPIKAARVVMEKTNHVMLTGEGADTFAESQGLEMVPSEYFYTERRWRSLMKLKERLRVKENTPISDEDKHGTVGAVALDKNGNLAAATSTGGHTNKMKGRIGDSPVIGSGTYANNDSCAVSCTGDGEYYMRLVLAYDIAARMRYAGDTLEVAANQVIKQVLPELGGSGGLIAIDRHGKIVMPFNTNVCTGHR